MTDRIRLSKHRALYVGPVNSKSQSTLKVKALNDRTTLGLMREPPSIYHITNFQTRAPRSEHMPVSRHVHPMHHIPEARGYSKHIKGSSLYKQHVLRNIQELSRML
jgi:hypothetical protein